MEKKQKPSGAGIVCYFDNRSGDIKKHEKDILYLCLTTHKGRYDFPKGAIDYKEEIEACALRETYEECNLDLFDFASLSDYSFQCGRGLFMFLGEIKSSSIKSIKIKMNPKIKIYEHTGFKFLTIESILKKDEILGKQRLYSYLIDSLKWADYIIRDALE